jgi:hypothetical protein
VAISSTFTGIAVVIVALRLYTRFFLVRYTGVEDYMILSAMVSNHRELTLAAANQVSFSSVPLA